jgi:hypothetical protein
LNEKRSPRSAAERSRLYARVVQRRKRRRRRLLGLTVAFGLLGLIGLYFATQSIGRNSNPKPRAIESTVSKTRPDTNRTATTGPTPSTVQPTTTSPAPQRGLLSPADRASFQRLERALGGSSGLVASGIGLARPMSMLGTLRTGVAWSTIKVPIALAVESRASGRPTPTEQELLTRAITASDNAAAEALWEGLGSPEAAAAAVQSVLVAGGDASTTVETRVLRPGFTSFGQTRWSLVGQQHFIAALPCLANSLPVLSLMHQVVPVQRWGLGTLSAQAQIKGGWGPDADGRYLVRQMGIISLANGRSIAVSMATIPSDGSFTTGTGNLTRLAEWLIAHVDASRVPGVRCQ